MAEAAGDFNRTILRRVLREITGPERGLTLQAARRLSSFLEDLGRRLASATVELVLDEKTSEIKAEHQAEVCGMKDVVRAVHHVMPRELAQLAETECIKALRRLDRGERSGRTHERAGLTFSLAAPRRWFRDSLSERNLQVSTLALVGLTAAIEYIAAEVLEVASQAEPRRRVVGVRAIQTTLDEDAELSQLARNNQ